MDLPRYGVCPMASFKCVMQLKTFCRTSSKDDREIMQNMKYGNTVYLYDLYTFINTS